MANATNYLEKKLLDHVLGKTSFTMPTVAYLAVLTADPTETGSLTSEIAPTGYARQAITTAMSATGATDGTSTNESTITFGPAGADWGSGDAITYAGVMDASTGGNMLIYMPLDTPQIINNGGNLQFPIGELTLSVA